MPQKFYFALHTTDPPVILHSAEASHLLNPYLPDRPVFRVLLYSTYLPDFEWYASIVSFAKKERPQDIYVHMHEDAQLTHKIDSYLLSGLKNHSILVGSQNQWVDETLFYPRPVAKTHDSIYVARMCPVKRHALAKDVASLKVVGGVHVSVPEYPPNHDSVEYEKTVLEALPQMTYVNSAKGWQDGNQMSEHYSSAKTSLALSYAEGGCRAVQQSLLCGVPVVSTHARGGREDVYKTPWVKFVDDTPEAISAAVNAFTQNPPPSTDPRRYALKHAMRAREDLLSRIRRWGLKQDAPRISFPEFPREETWGPFHVAAIVQRLGTLAK